MRSSIMSPRNEAYRNARASRFAIRPWAVAFWLILWQIAAMAVGRDFLLASPVTVLLRFWALIRSGELWIPALRSTARIVAGFLLGVVLGAGAAGLSLRWRRVRELIAPLWTVLRAIPVASYVIVALIWLPSRSLAVLISFLIVFPLIYAGALGELERTDPHLLEMARLFRMRPLRRLLYVYILPVLPAFSETCASAMGLAWKSGVAAELISIPADSIGERLYEAKVYLMTGDLFAWTLLIVLLSALCARLFSFTLKRAAARLYALKKPCFSTRRVGFLKFCGISGRKPERECIFLHKCRHLLPKNARSDVHAVTSDWTGCPAHLCQWSEARRRAPGEDVRPMGMELANVSKSYGSKVVLRGLSHRFPGGEISCVLGPSGCGKTTLLRLIAGLESSDGGEVLGAEGKKISAVFQENRLFESLTAEKNLMLTARPGFSRRDARELLASLGLSGEEARRVREFSGGMRRRVAVARALAADFDLLLLDEPLTGLDGDTRALVLDRIRRTAAGRTVIWVTHDPELPRLLGAPVLDLSAGAR